MELNDSTIKKLRWLIVFAVAAVVIGFNYRSVFSFAVRIFRFFTPFLLGGVMAFIINLPMRTIEGVIPLKRDSKLLRPLSLIISIVFVVGIVVLVTFVVMPQLIDTLVILQNSLPSFLTGIKTEAESLFVQFPQIADYINSIDIDWKTFIERVVSFLSNGAGTVLSSTFSAAISIISGVTTFFIGFVFAIYILLQKENLSRQFKKLMKAYLPEALTVRTLEILDLVHTTFANFFAGQCLEAIILGSMFFLTLSIFRLPYALLIGVLIAFTALIPMFGAFIGCVIGAFLMLMIQPVNALVFVIIFFVLQQIEGNLIYPHVVGNSVGLPSIWVLVAVTIGGSTMGIVGMLIFIPITSVIYTLLREAVNHRLSKGNQANTKKLIKP
ncbi:AI-2E family transporter [Lacrimispora aerotolerans]|uniref:AI-2E family transporter n=1 Tax=Lacrimispora aerotolerans TaxID=36832 RepID=UPI000554C73B|nr:AI-2E family transporter [Lacrimispora aerotolerans]